MRTLFYLPVSDCLVEFSQPDVIAHLREHNYLEVTGDLEDEMAFQQQQTGELDEDE